MMSKGVAFTSCGKPSRSLLTLEAPAGLILRLTWSIPNLPQAATFVWFAEILQC